MDANLRRGYLAQDLGVYLLRSFAAVAPVPGPDDVGIDAIATLLRQHTSRKLVAESSFYVQIKASSVRTVRYCGDNAKWLRELQLPFFIGSANVEDASLSLYTSHALSRVILEKDYEEYHLHLDANSGASERTPGSTSIRHVTLGRPVLTWSATDIADSTFLEKAYGVMKPWLDFEYRNIAMRVIRYCENLKWDTGQPPELAGMMMFSDTDPEKGLKADLTAMLPFVEKLRAHCFVQRNRKEIMTVWRLVNMMRSYGVDADPRGDADLFFRWVIRNPKK